MRAADSAQAHRADDSERERRVQHVFAELLRSHRLESHTASTVRADTEARIANLEAALNQVRQSAAVAAVAAATPSSPQPPSGSFVYDFEAEARLHHGMNAPPVAPVVVSSHPVEPPHTPTKLNFLSPSPRHRIALTFSPATAPALSADSDGRSTNEGSLLSFLRSGAPKTAKITIVQSSSSSPSRNQSAS